MHSHKQYDKKSKTSSCNWLFAASILEAVHTITILLDNIVGFYDATQLNLVNFVIKTFLNHVAKTTAPYTTNFHLHYIGFIYGDRKMLV